MNKFKFNFSFLDRFKKNKNETTSTKELLEEEIAQADLLEDTPPSFPPIAFRAKYYEASSKNSEFDSEETPEQFAEKTLGEFAVNKYQRELNEHAKEDNTGNHDSLNANLDSSNSGFTYQQMELPGKPQLKSKFNFKFPHFKSAATKDKFKSAFSDKSPLKSFEKFSWNDFVLRLFSPYTRSKIHSVFIILLVISFTYMLGKNLAQFFNKTPLISKTTHNFNIQPERADTTIQDINRISSTNLFNAKESEQSQGTTAKKLDIDSIICLEADKPTAVPIKLLDTIVLQDSVKSVASVQVRGSADLQNVREGERLDDMVEVSKINRMKLILKNLQTGDCEYATSETEAEPLMPPLKIISAQAGKALFKSTNPNIKNTGNSFKIKRSFRDSMINNMSEVLTQAKAIQITNPDGSLCFKMTEVVPGSIYSQLNIQENDIVCNLNGKKIENLNELMGLLGRIKEIDQFQIGLKRNGMNENLEYGFE